MRALPTALALGLLAAGQDPEKDLDRFLAEWAGRMKDLKTLEIRFRQEKRLKILRRPLLSRGSLRLDVAERRLRCVLLDPDGKVESELLATKEEVRILYPSLKRMEVYDLGAGAQPPVSFPGLGGDVEALKRDYQVRLERSDGEDRLCLSPRDPASPIREETLVLKEYRVRELIQVNRNGDSMRLFIDEFRQNAPLGAGDLKLEVPEGTEVVRPLAPRKTGPAPEPKR